MFPCKPAQLQVECGMAAEAEGQMHSQALADKVGATERAGSVAGRAWRRPQVCLQGS